MSGKNRKRAPRGNTTSSPRVAARNSPSWLTTGVSSTKPSKTWAERVKGRREKDNSHAHRDHHQFERQCVSTRCRRIRRAAGLPAGGGATAGGQSRPTRDPRGSRAGDCGQMQPLLGPAQERHQLGGGG